MLTVESLLDKLKARQAQLALESLKKPNGRTEFDYGLLVGQIQGFEQAVLIITNSLEEERNDERDL